MRRWILSVVLILGMGLMFSCDDDVLLLEFPADVVSRCYKLGNVLTGEDPSNPWTLLDALEIIEGLSQGGGDDIPVITVPAWISWDGIVPEDQVLFVEAIRDYDVEILFIVDPIPERDSLVGPDPPAPGPNFADAAVRQAFKDYSLDVITQIDPEYITLGSEINMYYHDDRIADYAHLNSLINETAALIRAASPETKILTTFQWEHLIFYLKSTGWEPIENFAWDIDILGITSFPMSMLFFLDPSRMREDYYTRLLDHFPQNHTPETLPIAFAEIGFASRKEIWHDGSEKHQSNGVVTVLEHATKFEHIDFMCYWYLHDHDGNKFQKSFGLIESTTTPGGTPGREKPAYALWEQLGQLPYVPNPIP